MLTNSVNQSPLSGANYSQLGARRSIDDELASVLEEARNASGYVRELADRLCGQQPAVPSAVKDKAPPDMGVFGSIQSLTSDLRDVLGEISRNAERISGRI